MMRRIEPNSMNAKTKLQTLSKYYYSDVVHCNMNYPIH